MVPAHIRSWGYAPSHPVTGNQERRLIQLLDRYHAVQSSHLVDELDVVDAILGEARPFSTLSVPEANRVAAHLNVRIALYTYFRDALPAPLPDFAQQVDFLQQDRDLLDRVIARAGWDVGEYFFPAHPLDKE